MPWHTPPAASGDDLKRLDEFVKLINEDGLLPSEAIALIGFDTENGPEVYPENDCLDFDDSDLIDFTPLATGADAIVVRRGRPGHLWELEFRYRKNTQQP